MVVLATKCQSVTHIYIYTVWLSSISFFFSVNFSTVSKTWQMISEWQSTPRRYHSTAVVPMDKRVLIVGGLVSPTAEKLDERKLTVLFPICTALLFPLPFSISLLTNLAGFLLKATSFIISMHLCKYPMENNEEWRVELNFFYEERYLGVEEMLSLGATCSALKTIWYVAFLLVSLFTYLFFSFRSVTNLQSGNALPERSATQYQPTLQIGVPTSYHILQFNSFSLLFFYICYTKELWKSYPRAQEKILGQRCAKH